MVWALTGARVLTPQEEIASGTVVVEGGRIVAVGAHVRPPSQGQLLSLAGLTLVPGFIDLHVHGGNGYRLSTKDPAELQAYARWVVSRGVTGFLASIAAAGHAEALDYLKTAASVCGPVAQGASLLGIHLEGPFISAAHRGALPPTWPRDPSLEELEAYLEAAGGHLRLLTLAPELSEARAVMEVALNSGVAVAMGHTDASYAEAKGALEAGISLVTHVYNAMRPFHHRDPGPVAAALESPGVVAEVIADGVHVHPAAVRLLLRAKGALQVALVTDGSPLAGLSEGIFHLWGQEVRLAAGRATLADGTLAGSALTMDRLVANLVEWGDCSLQEAVTMATSVPARVLGLAGYKGRIAPGYDADLVALDDSLEVVMTWVGGELVYQRPRP